MRLIKHTFKFTLFGLAGIITLILVYAGLAFGLSRIAVNRHCTPGHEVTIFILTNGVHTDIVVPFKNEVMDWSNTISYEHTKSKDSLANLVAFGWGDKGFYLQTPTWADLKFSVAFKAAFAMSTSAIHTTLYHRLHEDESCRSIRISKSEYVHLVEYIKSTLRTDEAGRSIHIQTDACYGDHDAFYEAKGSYSLFHTCNTWANNALKSCGQKASLWTPFDSGIFYHYSNKE